MVFCQLWKLKTLKLKFYTVISTQKHSWLKYTGWPLVCARYHMHT